MPLGGLGGLLVVVGIVVGGCEGLGGEEVAVALLEADAGVVVDVPVGAEEGEGAFGDAGAEGVRSQP
jgi:hypothetical protein